jgi:hypothetical protein
MTRRPVSRSRYLALLFASLLLLLPAFASTTAAQESACGTWAVATAPLQPGQPLSEDQIDLTTPDGTFLDSLPSIQPQSVIPTRHENRALIRSLDGAYALLDTTTGTAMELDFGENPSQIYHNPFYTQLSAGTQFALFGDPIGQAAFLVDLETGTVTPLSDLVQSTLPMLFGMVSPDDHHLLVQMGNDISLIPLDPETGTAGPAEQLDARFATFTSNGEAIVFIANWDDAGAEILIRDLASGDETTIAPKDKWFGVRAFSDGLILAARDSELVLLTPTGDPPQTVFDLGGVPFAMRYDPGSGNLLVRHEGDDVQSWWIVAVDGSAEPVEFPLLDDQQTVNQGLEGRWAFFPAGLAPGPGTPGNPYLSLDLATGTLTTIHTQDSNDIYFFDQLPSEDGRYRLIQAVSTPQSRLWLLDSETGTATLVGQSTGNAVGALTPDGCYLAVGTFDALGEGRQGEVFILDIATGATLTTIEDALLLGWAPIEASAQPGGRGPRGFSLMGSSSA